MFPVLHLLPLGVCLGLAAGWDVVTRRIPNPVTAATALSGVAVQALDRGFWSAASGLGAAALVIVLLYRAWSVGGIGGGDVKLAAAVAIWVGLQRMLEYALAAAVAGAVVAMISYAASAKEVRRDVRTNLTLAVLEQAVPPVEQKVPGRVSVPYGLAIAVGATFALLWKM
jgi:prepilin peptidase CpaA